MVEVWQSKYLRHNSRSKGEIYKETNLVAVTCFIWHVFIIPSVPEALGFVAF